MLKKFSVKNFRNFKEWFEFDFSTLKNYEFNTLSVERQMVKHGLIYGKNGCGKSNLGIAITDITSHLIDNINVIPSLSENYLNGDSSDELAEFIYIFDFNGTEVKYEYGKSEPNNLVYERFFISEKLKVSIDRRKNNNAKFNLFGTEHLKNDLSANKSISALKYLSANAILDPDQDENNTVDDFFNFIHGMVFFRTLKDKTESHGQPMTVKRISQAIISSGKMKDFEDFLNESEVKCKLTIGGEKGNELIYFNFENSSLEFSKVASTGTMSLGILYYWLIQLEESQLSFAYIDEFDAYYHFELSRAIVKRINNTNVQTLMTTHNTSLMSNEILRPDCYFEIKNNNQYHFFNLFDKELRKAHNLEKLYRSLGSDE